MDIKHRYKICRETCCKDEIKDNYIHFYPFDKLRYKIIKSVFISEDKTMLKIVDSDEKNYYFIATSECCNTVWIEHINGIKSLVGALVCEQEEPYWYNFNSSKKEREKAISMYKQGDYTDEFGFNINVDAGFFKINTFVDKFFRTCFIELRNAYDWGYGGGIEEIDLESKAYFNTIKFIEVKEDF